MTYNDFLEEVINRGIQGAKNDYTDPKDIHRLQGSIAGFEACRNKHPDELAAIYNESVEYVNKEFTGRDHEKYWWFRCYQLEVEWVCNVVSAMLHNIGQPPILSWLPTCHGMMQAAKIIGVKTT